MSDELDLLKSFIFEHVLAMRQMHSARGCTVRGARTRSPHRPRLAKTRRQPLLRSREGKRTASPPTHHSPRRATHRSSSNATRFSEPNETDEMREVTVESATPGCDEAPHRLHSRVMETVDPCGRDAYCSRSSDEVAHDLPTKINTTEYNNIDKLGNRDEARCVEAVDEANAKECTTLSAAAHHDPSNPLALGRRRGHPHWDNEEEQGMAKDNERSSPPIVYFGDNVLVDRYVLRHHGTDITPDHAELVRLVSVTARRRGGILENFLGDRFIVSFNATSRCVHHAVAAACFALGISTVVNSAAIDSMMSTKAQRKSRRRERETHRRLFAGPHSWGGRRRPGVVPASFRAAPCGLKCGVATGQALVGPLGTDSFRRHTIISNAVPEACALERMAIRYPNCSVLMGGDMIPEVDGYCQYLIVDASLVPGSGGQRRRVASVKGAMCAPGRDPAVLKGLVDAVPTRQLAVTSPYVTINDAFNAFLEGRVGGCAARVAEQAAIIQRSKEVHAKDTGVEGDLGVQCTLRSKFEFCIPNKKCRARARQIRLFNKILSKCWVDSFMSDSCDSKRAPAV